MIPFIIAIFLLPPDLPPPPDPFAVKLRIAEPKREKIDRDSLNTSFSLGDPTGIIFKVCKNINQEMLGAEGNYFQGHDFSLFTNTHAALNWLHLLPDAWWKIGMDYKRTKRNGQLAQSITGLLSVQLSFNLGLSCSATQTELFDNRRHPFSSLFPGITYNFHLLGYSEAKTIFYYQPGFRNFIDFSVADQIDINTMVFLRPAITFQTPENNLAFQIKLGSIIKQLALNAEFTHNRRQPLSLDSLYFAQPFFELNPALSPSLCHPALKLKIQFSTLELQFKRAWVNSFIYWTDSNQDSLFEPQNRDVRQDGVSLYYYTFQWSSLKNLLGVTYEKTIPRLDLIPEWAITDSFSFSIKGIGCEVTGSWIDSKAFSSRSLPPLFNLSSRLSYSLGSFKIFFAVDNILGQKYEALPYRFHQGRRFSLGCSLSKAI